MENQRGRGVFGKSIQALQLLNRLGYADPSGSLRLNLVYNPQGPSLPPPVAELEATYREELWKHFEIRFDALLTITNMPILRFAHRLERDGELDAYLSLLVNHFNPDTLPALMCRDLISVAYDGSLWDCDFNQMLEVPFGASDTPSSIWEGDDWSVFEGRPIGTAGHCFGCTAGSGSSCGGALVS